MTLLWINVMKRLQYLPLLHVTYLMRLTKPNYPVTTVLLFSGTTLSGKQGIMVKT